MEVYDDAINCEKQDKCNKRAKKFFVNSAFDSLPLVHHKVLNKRDVHDRQVFLFHKCYHYSFTLIDN